MKRAFLAVALAAASSAYGDVKLHGMFGPHAVLQSGRAIPVWGTAAPGEAVTLEIAGKNAKATADADGQWRAELPEIAVGGPFELVVHGTNELKLSDIYVGEVWLASGQSNMDFTVAKTKDKYFAGTLNEAEEIAAGDHPKIRMITVPLGTSDTPVNEVKADWKVCSPQTVGDFSAAAYFFARDLQKAHDVPIGIISTSFGASTAQAWISREAIAAEPQISSILDAYEQAKTDFASGAAKVKFDAAYKAWEVAATKAKAEGTRVPRTPGQPRDPKRDQHSPTVCYNAMIAPVFPYAFRGAIWYQGESNGVTNEIYLPLMTTLIKDWRTRWGNEFPFIAVQLAGYHAPATQPVARSEIASVREAQRLTMNVPNTAMATAVDIGDVENVHPKNKQEVGRRLALAARATVYGEQIEWTGPLLESAAIEGDAVRIRFTHAKGLAIKQGETALNGFTIQSADGAWKFADATIDGDSIRIPIVNGETPKEVRYAWADNPVANLVNTDGLPAIPFRAPLGGK